MQDINPVPVKSAPEISVAIIVCSRQRPQLLSRALESLTRLIRPDNCRVRFVVVENDATPQYGSIIERFGEFMDIIHIVEPVPGLCHARNAALDAAIEMGVDWLGSVDDDQIVDEDWLLNLVKAIRTYPDTNMFVGQWRRIEPENTPAWYPAIVIPNNKPTGTLIWSASGGNTIFSSNVFSPDAMALRFDSRFISIPGEDTEFGLHYLAKGGKMRHVLEAITTEEIHPERHSIKDRVIRSMWSHFSQTMIRHMHSKPLVATFWDLQIIYRGTTLGVLNILLGGLLWPIDTGWGKNRIAYGRILLGQPRGVFRYYFGKADGLYLAKTGK